MVTVDLWCIQRTISGNKTNQNGTYSGGQETSVSGVGGQWYDSHVLVSLIDISRLIYNTFNVYCPTSYSFLRLGS